MTQARGESHADDIVALAWAAEEAVYRPETRHKAEVLERLFAPGFHEIGQSGYHWQREELIANLVDSGASDGSGTSDASGASDDTSFQLSERHVDHLSDDAILLIYQLEFAGQRSRRSSVWVMREGELALIFHQGTTVALHVRTSTLGSDVGRSTMAHDSVPVIEELTEEQCWKLLEKDGVGRLATAVVDPATGNVSPDIFPINFHLFEKRVFFRTAPGSKLIDLTAQSSVAFQTDGHHGRVHWSVVVRGIAHRMVFDNDIEESGILKLHTTVPTDKWNYVRIEAEAITGIRFHGA